MSDSKYDRVCTKLAIVGKAKERGVTINLYLKVALPTSSSSHTYALLSDEGVSLQNAKVYALNAAQEAQATNLSALGVMKALKIRTSGDDDSFPTPGAPLPKVINSNYSIGLYTSKIAPLEAPYAHARSTRKPIRTDKRFFVVCLQLHAAYTLSPPRHPHLVKFPIPVCLNNHLRFTVEDKACQLRRGEQVSLNINPRILPKGGRHSAGSRSSGAASSSEEIDFDDGTSTQRAESEYGSDDDETHDGTVAGRFAGGSNFMVIRWAGAAPGSGAEVPSLSFSESTFAVDVRAASHEKPAGRVTFPFKAELTILSPHLSVLKDCVKISLDAQFANGNDRIISIDSVDASCGLLEWRARAMEASESQHEDQSSEAISTPSSSIPPSDSFLNHLKKPTNEKYDESDLWVTRPPEALLSSSSDMDLSMDPAALSSSPRLISGTWRQDRAPLANTPDGIDILLDPDVVCGHGGAPIPQSLVVSFTGQLSLQAENSDGGKLFKVPNIRLQKGTGLPLVLVPDTTSGDARVTVRYARTDQEATLRRKDPLLRQHVGLLWSESAVTPTLRTAETLPAASVASDASADSAILRAGSPISSEAKPVCTHVSTEIFAGQESMATIRWSIDLEGSAKDHLRLNFASPPQNLITTASGMRLPSSLDSSAKERQQTLDISRLQLPPSTRSITLQWTQTKSDSGYLLPTSSLSVDRLDLVVSHGAAAQNTFDLRSTNDAFVAIHKSTPNTLHAFSIPADHPFTLVDMGPSQVRSTPPSDIKELQSGAANTSSPKRNLNFTPWALFLVVTCMLFFFVDHHQKAIRILQDEVELLSMAANVDFREGFWSEPPTSSPTSVHRGLPGRNAVRENSMGVDNSFATPEKESHEERQVSYGTRDDWQSASEQAELDPVAGVRTSEVAVPVKAGGSNNKSLQAASSMNPLAYILFSPIYLVVNVLRRVFGLLG